MRAAVVRELGQAPRIADRPDPRSGEGKALIRLTAASINPVDLHISSGGHPAGVPPVPHVPGVEGVGTVVESGGLEIGTRVRVSVPGCFVDGTFAELIAVPETSCVPLPAGLDDALAAAVGIVGVSALVGLRDEARLQPGESVLVLGATGGLGRALIRIARSLGAQRIVAAGRDPERLETLTGAGGADAVLVLDPAASPETIGAQFAAGLAATGGPVDVVADLVWGPFVPAALASLAPGGRYLNLGQTAGPTAPIDAALLRHSRLHVSGFSATALPPDRAAAAYRDVADLAARSGLDLAITQFPLSEVESAWKAQAASPGGKIVLRP